MAELHVLGSYQGPGEKKTVERLAAALPAEWFVIAGRKLPGERRDDIDIVVVGHRALFVAEEKAWGPLVELGDVWWRVNGEDRVNPLDRVNHLARRLAGLLGANVAGYRQAAGRHRLVTAAVVLSHDRLELREPPGAPSDEIILRLADAPAALEERDAGAPEALAPVRGAVVSYLLGLAGRDPTPERLGQYEILQAVAPVGRASCFLARSDDRYVLLRCYPLHGWGDGVDPMDFIRREMQALQRLEAKDRTWRTFPSFVNDARQWFVVPIELQAHHRSLLKSVADGDPVRQDGKLPIDVALKVVRDAFAALADVHEEKVVHRGLHPSRVFLGRQLRVKFSDFYLARLTGGATIAPWLDEFDADRAVPFRAPECHHDIRLASDKSDVYALALCLACWLLNMIARQPDHAAVREAIEAYEQIGELLAACLQNDPEERPDALTVESALTEQPSPTNPAPSVPSFEVDAVINGRYRIERHLGRGGFASSWLVYDETAQDRRVLKQFLDVGVATFARQEFEAASRLNNDLCARVWDISEVPTPGYLILEYVPGVNLREFAEQRHPDAETFRAVALDVLSALAYVHGKELLHRDVTPNNIVVSPDGRGKLIDFGLCSRVGSSQLMGTMPYMAPELIRGAPATVPSDLYGVGASFLATMLGRFPYRGAPGAGAVRDSAVAPLTDAERDAWGPDGAAILGVLFEAVNPDPLARPRSAEEFADNLRTARGLEDLPGEPRVNPTVASLRHLYRGSKLGNAGNRGLDDGFAQDTYVPTRLDDALLPAVLGRELRLVILTGNPGDGKTSFLVMVRQHLAAMGAEELEDDAAGWRLRLDGHTFVAVYDASESHEGLSSDQLILRALEPRSGESPTDRTVLLAVNDGRLLQFFTDYDHMYPDQHREVRRQMRGEPPAEGTRTAVVDLKRRSLAGSGGGLATAQARELVRHERWAVCDGCSSLSVCPMNRNAMTLRADGLAGFNELVLTSHLRRRRRATFRDVRSALGWLVTGDLSCDEVHAARDDNRDLTAARGTLLHDLAFDALSADYLVREWCDFDPARVAAPQVERTARLNPELVPDLDSFDGAAVRDLQRHLFFDDAHREEVRAYRHLSAFLALLTGDAGEEGKRAVLLGLSRIVGAPGYRGPGLAVAGSVLEPTWAVLKEVPAEEFELLVPLPADRFVEAIPDRVTLRHSSGASLVLSLDTAELVLRCADGELLDDPESDAVRQEIDGFAAQLRVQPAGVVQLVDPSGTAVTATRRGTAILLEAP